MANAGRLTHRTFECSKTSQWGGYMIPNLVVDSSVTDANQRLFVQAQYARMVKLLQVNWLVIPLDAQNAINQIDTLIVIGDLEYLGDYSSEMKLSYDYIAASSLEWFASIPGHEGQHRINHGKIFPLWKDEQSACVTQMLILQALKASQSDIDYLARYSASSNSQAMQAHMVGGFRL
jgi:hypothetical protein